MFDQLLYCALRRRGRPGNAEEIYDDAIGLAQREGWPRRTYTAKTPTQLSAHLRYLEKAGLIVKVGDEKGRNPSYAPRPDEDPEASRWDSNYPIPDRPDPTAEDHPLIGKTERQKFVMFDVLEEHIRVISKHRRELKEFLERQEDDLVKHVTQLKSQLLAEGFGE